ncbi:Exonuclease mut-7 homolog [Eumeta japonica]|uniref:Exonuclease mut-7 homolog n=1 Tax=Eumeta variegata TaxID=151549 RepID=A0A4C1YAU0_EUMVA|nr:Exonuclease mut-7 homolog [Eumeta japonica]
MNLNTLVCKNQSIKIIPPIEDSLRSLGFDVDLNENAIAWLNHLKATWKTWKNSATVENHVENFFVLADKPFHLALAIIIKCDEFKDSKPKSLPYFIIETLDKWSTKHQRSPSNDVKLPAFRIAIQQRNHCFQTLVIKTYKISSINGEILPMIKEMIKNGNHKQAAIIVIATKLFNEIPVEDILFPLILQDKANMVDDYLIQCPSQVVPFLQFLDKLLDKSFNIQEFIQSYLEDHKITDVKYEKMHYKPLGKLVARLCNKFKIPINQCKNLSKNRTTGGLRYLIFQKYQEHNVSLTVWDDLVKDALEQNSDSAIEFIDTLVDYDKKEALKWAEYLKIPVNSYPAVLREPIHDNIDSSENWDEEPSTSQKYYKIPFDRDQIKIVDNTEKFYDMVATDLSNCTVIGIDCEWKPTFGTSQTQVALMQISTSNMVYLIDTLLLNKKEFISFWYMFNKSLLDNAEIIKIGFGLEQDLKEIKASIVGLHNIKVKGEGLLDLSLLWKSLLNTGLTLPFNTDSGGVSLSAVVQSCFGLPLAKSEQCSNWELRPLRDTQIEYAALDSFVLMKIYLHLQKLCNQQGINFDEICNDVMVESKQKTTKKLKIADRLKSSLAMCTNKAKEIHQVKFLVDPPLSNLLTYLSHYFGASGVDGLFTMTKNMVGEIEMMEFFEISFRLMEPDIISTIDTYSGITTSQHEQEVLEDNSFPLTFRVL